MAMGWSPLDGITRGRERRKLEQSEGCGGLRLMSSDPRGWPVRWKVGALAPPWTSLSRSLGPKVPLRPRKPVHAIWTIAR